MTVTAMPAHNNRARQPEDTVMEGSNSGMRAASVRDAAACLEIYRPYVLITAISWEIDVPTVAEMARIDGLRATHEWLVLERDAQIIGFAYGPATEAGGDLPVVGCVAWKHDSWHDVAWMQLDLLGTAGPDRPPARFADPQPGTYAR
jgi:L-amino acid N-acyltransferase YncA